MSKKPDTNVGITAGVKYWLVFMLGLAVLGYSPFLSITFGAIGGIASGIIAAWLKPKDEYNPTKKEQQARREEEEKPTEPAEPGRFRRRSSIPTRHQRRSRNNRRLDWLFRRRS